MSAPTYRKRAIPQATRRAVAIRNGGKPFKQTEASCEYCGQRGVIHWMTKSWVYFAGLELDHVVAELHGGTAEPANIVLACRSCNRSKGHRRTAAQMRASA